MSSIDWDAIQGIVAVVGLAGAGLMAVGTQLYPLLRAWRAGRLLGSRLSGHDFPPAVIENAVRYFVEPSCTDVDPAGREDYRSVFVMSQPLYRTLDRLLYQSPPPHHVFLLADSGIGKTTSLLNYFLYNLQRRNRRDIHLIYLGASGALERIQSISAPENAILFLDALDEDLGAVQNHAERVRQLMQTAARFRSVVITCRSQFFLADEEITRETGIVRIGPRAAGEASEYVFKKFYIAPFEESQIRKYLKRRYTIGQRTKRLRAKNMLGKIGDLSARPMILAYTDDLVQQGDPVTSIIEAYERIIDAWLERERYHVGHVEKLRSFSEQLAVDLFVASAERGGEFVSVAEVAHLANEWKIDVETWKLTGRSLLNRNAMGQFKFAHRSIMEYLIVKSALFRGNDRAWKRVWTAQMVAFAQQMILRSDVGVRGRDLNLSIVLTEPKLQKRRIDYISDSSATTVGITAITAITLKQFFESYTGLTRATEVPVTQAFPKLVQLIITALSGVVPICTASSSINKRFVQRSVRMSVEYSDSGEPHKSNTQWEYKTSRSSAALSVVSLPALL